MCLVAQSCSTLCDLMDCSMPGFPVHHNSWSLLKLMSIESVMTFNYLILCHLFFLPPSIFPSIRVFSSESVLCISWPKHWSFNFSVSPSSEYSGLISLVLTSFLLGFPLRFTEHGPCTSEQDPVPPTVSFSHQEASISFLSLLIRGQTE